MAEPGAFQRTNAVQVIPGRGVTGRTRAAWGSRQLVPMIGPKKPTSGGRANRPERSLIGSLPPLGPRVEFAPLLRKSGASPPEAESDRLA